MEYTVSMIDFYEQLYAKYSDYLRPDITDVIMIQTDEEVSLEVHYDETTEEGFDKVTITRTDLGFVVEDTPGEPFFRLDEPIEKNVVKFLNDFSPYSIICTTDLFTNEAAQKINKKFCIFGVDK